MENKDAQLVDSKIGTERGTMNSIFLVLFLLLLSVTYFPAAGVFFLQKGLFFAACSEKVRELCASTKEPEDSKCQLEKL